MGTISGRVVAAAVATCLALASPALAQSDDPGSDPVGWLTRNLGGAACVVYDAGPSTFRMEHIIENTEVQFDGCTMVLQQASTTGARSELRTFRIPLAELQSNSVTSKEGFPLPEGWTTRGDVPTHTIMITTPAGQPLIETHVDQFDGSALHTARAGVVTLLVRHEENASGIVLALTRAIALCRQ